MAIRSSVVRLAGAFTLAPLPYALDALEPHISARTLQYHYGKHHQAYVNKLNELVKGSTHPNHESLEGIIKNESGVLYNQCPAPKTETLELIKKNFGSLEDFKAAYKTKVLSHFGSGWVWLVYDSKTGTLELLDGHDALCPLSFSAEKQPVLTCDVWEHAYYLDTQNDRGKYFENYWNVINWDFVEQQIKSA